MVIHRAGSGQRTTGPGRARLIGCARQPSRYDAVAVAFGDHGEKVSRADAMAPSWYHAFLSGQPACLNVMIDGLPAPVTQRS